MRQIVAFNRLSADGYFTARDGSLNWTVPEPELDKTAVQSLGGADTILFGRRTYEMFESFWPHVLEDSPTAPDPHMPGRRAEEMRALAVWINDATKIVFSRNRPEVTWKNSRLERELRPHDIDTMKRQPGHDIMLFGSGSIASLLTTHGLIDEYHFIVGPILLGSGRTLLSDAAESQKLKLVETRPFPMGNVLLRYARA